MHSIPEPAHKLSKVLDYYMESVVRLQSVFTPQSTEDVIRVDGLCGPIIEQFFDWMGSSRGYEPEQASRYAYAVDYYVRDYLVDALIENPLNYIPGRITAFAGSWYLQKTMEPNREQIETHLAGIRLWYEYLLNESCISAESLVKATQECDDIEYYATRLESFMALAGEGFTLWLTSLRPVWERENK